MGIGLLAPVPAVFLRSALDTCAAHGKVAFGTDTFEVFAKLDQLYGVGVTVLICPTGQHGDPDGLCTPGFASLRASYRGTQQAWHGKHPIPALRPTATLVGDQQDSAWAVFWEVSDLVRLSKAERVSVLKLTAEGKKRPLPLGFVLHGPMLVTAPFL